MTITKELRIDQVKDLDLHQGDTLTVVAERGETLLVEILHANQNQSSRPRTSAGDWGRQYTGAARLENDESTEDVRSEHYRQKYGA
ncbi:MAG TPA: hypothetical protein VLE43_12140 [Candidatus Saccharimonadia bacterium]|nr:hypothetical protein [Candidatus Saccharimonadia bacterium]